MGSSARFLMLLTTPYPFLNPRPTFFLRLARNSRFLTSRLPSLNPNHSTRSLFSFSPIRAIQSESFHSQSNAFKDDTFTDQFGGVGGSVSAPNWYHPWPEWSRFIEYMRQGGYFERVVDGDAWGFVSGDNFSSPEFYKAALACLEFARDRDNILGYLTRSDIRVVLENGSANLFRDAEMLRSKMKGLFGVTESGVINFERPTMVDLMKFLISSANIRPVTSPDNYHSSEHIVVASVRNLLSEMANLNFGSRQSDYPGSMQTQYSDRSGQAPTPRGQHIEMKRGDWICPKCTFMNFARNMKCLECDEARPRRQLTNGEWECPQCDFFNYGRNVVCLRCDCKRPGEGTLSPAHTQWTNLNRSGTGIQQATNDKAQWSSGYGSQLNNSSDSNQRFDSNEFPEIMPLRKGVNRFVVSTRKTPLERRLANAQAQDEEDVSSGMNNKSYGHVPFVPLPPDMFSTKPPNDLQEMAQGQTSVSHYSQGGASPSSTFRTNEPDKPSESSQFFERPASSPGDKGDNAEVEKSERWFKRVSELHDVADLSSAIPDEDFPELMPMRKGENRFVVSKKNDRSLTTPMNKRRAAMEQPNESKFVPFVPFPPDYFAKKEQSQAEALKSSEKSTKESHKPNASVLSPYSDTKPRPDTSFENSPQSNSSNTWGSNEASNNAAQDFNSGFSGRSSSTKTDLPTNSLSNIQKENTTIKDGWSGKSLEGSAVTEIDPLDMSEEAKAERWFRRAAQIKDISELSQIPDEDFPSIMPMRKGVNRFVVSKRKTPLERRLTSTQYRRNLPVVESDPTKTPNDSN